MTWLFYLLLIILLATFNVLALDSISKVRKDISQILSIVKGESEDDDSDSVIVPRSLTLTANATDGSGADGSLSGDASK